MKKLRKSALPIVGVALGVILAFLPSSTAVGDDISDEAKQAQVPAQSTATDGYVSSLEEENSFAAQAVAEELSPGAYEEDGIIVSRIYSDTDTSGLEGKTVLPSRFTQQELKHLEEGVASLAGEADIFFGFNYDAKTDSLFVTGNLDESHLDAEAISEGLITFEWTSVGRRQTRASDSAPH